jgi:hypothetical protein
VRQGSWADRLTDRVNHLPWPDWVTYGAIWLLVMTAITTVHWAVGAYDVGTIPPIHVALSGATPMALWLFGRFNASARDALRGLGPLLREPGRRDELERTMTSLPAIPTLVVTTLIGLLAIIRVLSDPAALARIQIADDPRVRAVALPIAVALAASWSALALKVGWLAWQVHRVSTREVIIRMSDLAPLHSFSGMTGRMAMSLVLPILLVMITAPRVLTDSLTIGLNVLAIAMAAGVFVGPLLGLHGLLVAEKDRLRKASAVRMEQVLAELHQAVEARDLAVMDPLNKAIASLDIELRAVERIPTWPWQPETVRWVASALMFPVVVFLAQLAIGRLLP